MICIGLQRHCHNGAYETLVVNPYHVSSYYPWPVQADDRKSVLHLAHGQTEHVRETIHEMAKLIIIATTIKSVDLPPDVLYVSVKDIDFLENRI